MPGLSGLPESMEWADAWGDSSWKNLKGYFTSGVVYRHSQVKLIDIKDGTASTYLAGEKYIDPDHYLDGTQVSDNVVWDMGWANDVVRFSGSMTLADAQNRKTRGGFASTDFQPRQDTPGFQGYLIYGSGHPIAFNAVFCDGSVHAISYSINNDVHHRLGNIADGVVIDGNAL